MLLSCLLGALGFCFASPLILLLSPGATSTAIQYSVAYLRVYAVFSPLLLVFFATDNYLRVCGKEKFSMWIGITTQMLNILLDWIFIVIMGQGVQAAALASCISMAVGSAATLLLFSGKKLDLYYTAPHLCGQTFLRILGNGSSEFFSNISTSVMSIVLNLFLLRYGGTTCSILLCFILRHAFISDSFFVCPVGTMGLYGVWLMPTAAGMASGIFTLILAGTMGRRLCSHEISP